MITEALIAEAIEAYRGDLEHYRIAAERCSALCQDVLDERGIRGTVSARVKAPERLERKLRKYMKQGKTEPKNKDIVEPQDVFVHVGDLVGLRVLTYVEAEVTQVVEQVQSVFPVAPGADGYGVDSKHNEFGYRATHVQVGAPVDDGCEDAWLAPGGAEIQVCSLLAHVWNEVEHDICYKELSGPVPNHVRGLFKTLSRLTHAGDELVNTILSSMKSGDGDFEGFFDFLERGAMRFGVPDSPNKGRHSKQLYELVKHMNVRSPSELQAMLEPIDPSRAVSRGAEFNTWLDENAGRYRTRFEPDTSDVLLVRLLMGDAAAVAGQARALAASASGFHRLAWLAARYEEFAAEGRPPSSSVPPASSPTSTRGVALSDVDRRRYLAAVAAEVASEKPDWPIAYRGQTSWLGWGATPAIWAFSLRKGNAVVSLRLFGRPKSDLDQIYAELVRRRAELASAVGLELDYRPRPDCVGSEVHATVIPFDPDNLQVEGVVEGMARFRDVMLPAVTAAVEALE